MDWNDAVSRIWRLGFELNADTFQPSALNSAPSAAQPASKLRRTLALILRAIKKSYQEATGRLDSSLRKNLPL